MELEGKKVLHKEKMNTSIIRTFFAIMLLTAAFVALSIMNASESFALSGEGTEQDPYKISTEEDWNEFAGEVRTGNTGGYYRLTKDITIESPVGTEANPFTGHFDGASHTLTADISDTSNQGTAPFRYIQGAEIKDLKVDGTVRGGAHVAGLVGYALGGNGAKNLIDNATVADTVNGGDYAGGIVGHGKTSDLTIKDSRFTGVINGGSKYAGGFLGWSDGQKLTIRDCLFSGSYGGSGKFHPVAVKDSNKSMTLDISGAYYANTAEPAMQGDSSHVVTDDGVLTYAEKDADVSNGHFYRAAKINGSNSGYYYPVEIEINMGKGFYQHSDTTITYEIKANGETLTDGTDYTAKMAPSDYPNLDISAAQILQNAGTYIIVINGKGDCLGKMASHFVVSDITGSGTSGSPYQITSQKDWDQFTGILTTGKGETFEGKYLKLTNNITVTKMAGTSTHPFSGTFDGQNKTLTSKINADEDEAAPFHYIKGATIKNITAAGSVQGKEHCAGLVGYALGNRDVVNRIDRATVTATVTSTDNVSGLVGNGDKSTIEITNTIFSGKLCCNMFNRRYTGTMVLASNSGAKLIMNNCMLKGSKGNSFYWWNPIALLYGNSNFEHDIKNTYFLDSVAYADDVGLTTPVGGTMVYKSAISGKISTKVTAVDNVTYYHDEDIKIEGLRDTYAYTGSNISVTYKVMTSNGTQLKKDSDYTSKWSTSPVKNKGNYTLTITGTGDYAGSISANFKVADQLSGSGTEADPFRVESAADWNKFKSVLNGGHSYKGEFIKLTADISVGNNMIGTSSNPFSGTFDGGGHKLTVAISNSSEGAAPFSFVKDATIRNLTVAGTVQGGKYTSGLVGELKDGPVNIKDVTVSATVKADKHLGGFIGHSFEEKATLVNCVFNGTLSCTGSEGYGGGLYGWGDKPNYDTWMCMFTGKVTGKFKLFHPVGVFYKDGGGYYGGQGDGVYYTSSGKQIGAADGTALILGTKIVRSNRLYTVSEMEDGQLYTRFLFKGDSTDLFLASWSNSISVEDKVLVKGYKEQVTLPVPVVKCNGETLNPGGLDIKCYFHGEEVSADDIRESGEYTLKVIGREDYFAGSVSTTFKVIFFSGVGTEDDPFLICNEDDWNYLAEAVSLGHTFKGQFLILANNDVVCTQPVGDANHPFQGHFDGLNQYGNNRVLTANISDTSTQGTAPFRYVGDGAVIKNIDVKGTIQGGQHAGGLVGFTLRGTVNIYDVNVSATITDGSYVGGIVGHGKTSNLTMQNCAFTGRITGGSSYIGGLLGWSDGQKLTLERCIFAGRNTGSGAFHPIAVKNRGESMDTTQRKVYYVNTQTPDISNDYIAAGGTPVYTKADFPEDKLSGSVNAADGKTYYALTKVGTIKDNYEITGSGIAPVPVVSDAEGAQLTNGRDFTTAYVNTETGESVTKVTAMGEYRLVLTGNNSKTVGTQEAGTFTASADHPQEVTLNAESAELHFDVNEDTVQLVATVKPDTVSNKEVEWTSSDADVATVDDTGLVTAKGVGTAVITARAKDNELGEKTATCEITVVKTPAKLIVPPSKNVLTYNGADQKLLNPGEAYGGTIKYAGEDGAYSADIPEGNGAGTYKVSYKIEADEGHTDAGPWQTEVKIEKAEGGVSVTNKKSVRTEGSFDLDDLVTKASDGADGTVSFSITSDDTNSSIDADNVFHAGTYGSCTVKVTVEGRSNYSDIEDIIEISVEQKEIVSVDDITMSGWTFGQEGGDPAYELPDTARKIDVMYSGIKRGGETYTDIRKKPQEAGSYEVYVWAEDDDHIYFGGTGFEIAPKSIEGAEVTLAGSLTYNGEEQVQAFEKVELDGVDITGSCVIGGNYAADGEYIPADDHGEYRVVNAGKYTMVVTASETGNYTGSVEKEFTVAKADPTCTMPKAITGLVYNGLEQTLIKPGTAQGGVFKYDMAGSGLYTDIVPAAADAGTYRIAYKIAGDANHNDLSEGYSIEVTIAPAACEVDEAPAAIEDLIYNGKEQELVTAGSSSNGVMVYRVGENGEYSVEIPAAKKAGDYTVYYKSEAKDSNHSDSEEGSVAVSIGRNGVEVTPPQAVEDLVYNGEAQELITAGETTGGTIVYKLAGDEAFSEDIPVATDAGEYEVVYKVDGGGEYNDTPENSVNVTIGKAGFPGRILRGGIQAGYEEQIDLNKCVSCDFETEFSIVDDQTPSGDCVLDAEAGKLTTGTSDGKCYVGVSVKGNSSNYEDEYIFAAISSVSTLDIGVYQDDVTYGKGGIDPQFDDYGTGRATVGPKISYSGTLADGTRYGTSEEEESAAPTEVGSYTVSVYYMIGDKAYYGDTDFNITPANISGAKVTLGNEIKYDGTEQTQEVSKIELDGKDITDLCTVSGNTAVDYGSYELTFTANEDADNYYGSGKAAFTVYPDDKTLEDAKEAAIAELEKKYNTANYSGNEKAQVQKALEDAKKAIRNARTLDEIEQAKAAADSSSTAVKKNNTFNVKGKTAKLSSKKLRKKAQKLKAGKVIQFVNNGQGARTYKLVSAKKGSKNFKKYFAVNKKNGMLTVKKGLKKKGVYTVKVKVNAAGTAKYKASGWKTVTIKIRVK